MRRKRVELSAEVLVTFAALLTSIIVFGIFYFLVSDGVRVFGKISLKDFFLSTRWYPTYEDAEFGILALLAGTLSVTGLTLAVAIPMGFICAIFLAEFSGKKSHDAIKYIFELMAGIPSVVLGSFGLKYVSRWLMEHFPLQIWTGLNVMNASLMLSVLAMPYFVTLMEDALRAVPIDQKEASLALGANMTGTIFRILLPQARSGILNAIILGTNRVIGETMVVLMIAGGATMIPSSIFDPVRPLTSAIAGEMGEVELGSTHYFALFMIGVVLMVISTAFTLIAMKLKRSKEK
ncbi:MAG TPA: phosphate ABC transporter permease subunit PstC [Mesotoga infera]|nr:phosphate ABC transporter permease subunit PstC [Thermotogaceae bacterium]HNS66545.1 phosphate ABC transporter permease subunit PstC [Mesotoga infera]HRR44757.1 phosphate ABC transporter permease subunit PstC [Mesotoga sp.]HOI34680.1 phosphate ABC transporter permease subunit PstC [Mesotoga infera]HPD38525.1 phosphate ABC transporter permease subunit PstC [Mesotoga infera]